MDKKLKNNAIVVGFNHHSLSRSTGSTRSARRAQSPSSTSSSRRLLAGCLITACSTCRWARSTAGCTASRERPDGSPHGGAAGREPYFDAGAGHRHLCPARLRRDPRWCPRSRKRGHHSDQYQATPAAGSRHRRRVDRLGLYNALRTKLQSSRSPAAWRAS